VDSIYHSDSLYAAVTSAMARLGTLEDWLNATARSAAPAVCFSSCFPYLDNILCVVPPRTIWPPTAAGISARVRWKSARFAPLEIVRDILAGRKLEEGQWSLDGSSECLTPAGSPGPFRTSVRWSAAVDRFTGATERHSTACIEFRSGCGLWAVASFLDEAARDRWQSPLKAAFRLLADSGFGGERSRGWGRSDPPEFAEGDLPDMILPPLAPALEAAVLTEEVILDRLVANLVGPEAVVDSSGAGRGTHDLSGSACLPDSADAEQPAAGPGEIKTEDSASAESPAEIGAGVAVLEMEDEALETQVEFQPIEPEPAPAVLTPVIDAPQSHWLLSLYTPAPDDTVDWRRGSYAVLTRGGRVESPAGSGGLKKQLQMIAEGSVLSAVSEPRGSATDVGPEGFPHPVYRAGFALSIPLPEVR
jgi:CRISPR/Cas system CSM-associated protein Csm4 (group 5 of RAMP superfamily)